MKRGKIFWFGMFAVAFSAGGCGLFGDSYDVDFETDDDTYLASTATTMALTIENTGSNVVYYQCAGDFHLERFANDELVDSIGAVPNCSSLDAVPIESDETWTGEITLDENVVKWLFENSTQAVQTGVEVTYRLRLELFEDTQFQNELEHDEERSNAFTFEYPTE